ncbi:MAG: hypothetical protein KDK60_02150 [Chlamydiia bacterium]|nr:hypothetical protein [Chlamydiia bacterium]
MSEKGILPIQERDQQQMLPQISYERRQRVMGTLGVVCTVGTITLVALSIIYDLGTAWNATLTIGSGLSLQMALNCIPYRRKYGEFEATKSGQFVNREKDLLVKYAATFFITLTQVYLNVPNPRWLTRLTFGLFNALLGMQLATKVDNILHWTLRNEKTSDSEFLIESNTKLNVLMGNQSASRRIIEGIKIVVGVAGIVLGHYLKWGKVPIRFGTLLLGHAGGTLFHETVHGIRLHMEKKFNQSEQEDSMYLNESTQMPTGLKVVIVLEKIEQVVGVIFPGMIIAFDHPAGDVFSGLTMGLSRQIDWIRYTETPYSELHELKNRNDYKPSTLEKMMWVVKWTFAIGVAGYIGFGIYQAAIAKTFVDAYALGTFITVLYSSYFLTRIADRSNLPGSHFLNTLFFYTNYSIAAPVVYIAVSQVMKIGDIALNKYALYKTVVACIGWSSLAWAFGTQAGQRATTKAVTFPAEVDPLILLYTVFFVQQLIGKA